MKNIPEKFVISTDESEINEWLVSIFGAEIMEKTQPERNELFKFNMAMTFLSVNKINLQFKA